VILSTGFFASKYRIEPIVFISRRCQPVGFGHNHKAGEHVMELEITLILGLVVLFVGGIGFLTWKESREQRNQGSQGKASTRDNSQKTQQRKTRKI